MAYSPPNTSLDASWSGLGEYPRPSVRVHGVWAEGTVSPPSVDALCFGATFVTKQQFVDPAAWDSSSFPAASLKVTLNWEYPTPYAVVSASWVGALSYTPPAGEILAQWTQGYGPAEDQFFDPHGFEAQTFGTTSLRNTFEIVSPSGFDSHQPSPPSIWNLTQQLKLGGIPSKLAFGQTKIENLRRYLTLAGINSNVFGVARLQGGIWPLNVYGIPAPITGAPWVSCSPRFLEPVSIPWNFYTLHQVGTHQGVQPQGFEATQWGTRIVPESQSLYPEGFAGEFGDAWASLGTRYLLPNGFKFHAAEEHRFGYSRTWNWQSYYDISTDPNDPAFSGETFGIWTSVENRNKVITHHSTSPGALPSPQIDNAARPLLTTGIAAPDPGKWEKTADVSHGIRFVQPQALLSEVVSRWGVVANGARLLKTSGELHEQLGVGTIWNNRRWLNKVGDFEATQWGSNRVSPGITHVTFDPRYTVEPPRIEMPNVRLNTRYVEVAEGLDSYRTGGHALHIHWNIAYPKWTYDTRNWTGVPEVKNVTPMLRQMGRNSEEFGDTQVRTAWREIVTLETYATQFGKTKIADRRLWINPAAAPAPHLPLAHEVFNLDPDPPALQKVVIQGHQSIGYGPLTGTTKLWYPPQPVDNHGFGEPTMNAISIFPVWEEDSGVFGNAVVSLQGVINATVGYELGRDMANPTVWMRVRRLYAAPPTNTPPSDFLVVGNPRLSPHTIYSVVEVTAQAIRNHDWPGHLHYVDEVLTPSGSYWLHGPGTPAVGHRYRYVAPRHEVDPETHKIPDPARYGVAKVANKHHWVRPEGLRSMSFGRPVMMGTRRNIEVVNNISELDDAELAEHKFGERFSKPMVAYRVRKLSPAGIHSTNKFDPAVVDHFHRFVKPTGWFSQAVGEYSGYQNPYQWQRLRVGPLVPNYMEGFDASACGETWVSLFRRGVSVPGFVATQTGPSEDAFALRMRVRRGTSDTPAARAIYPSGVGAHTVGGTGLMNMTQFIRPDGNMDNYRKGAPQ